jgi:hypothetical protein
VSRYIRTSNRLTEEAKRKARGTDLEDKIEALHEISYLPADEQPAAARLNVSPVTAPAPQKLLTEWPDLAAEADAGKKGGWQATDEA